MSPSLADRLQTAFQITWAKSSLKYLGVRLTDRYDTLYAANFLPLLATVKNDLATWTKTAFTWLGRLAVVKMNILPRILFYMQMLPMSLPKVFFTQVSSLISKFIWNDRKPRIALRLLTRPREVGGLGLPDIQRYHRAIILQRILNWRFHAATKVWAPMEKCMAGRNLSYAPWLSRG